MKRIRRMILLPLLASIGLVGGTMQPAMATTLAEVEFAVTVTTPPVGLPTLHPAGSGTITVTSTQVCVAEVVSGKSGPNAGTCTISGTGTIGAGAAGGSYCGTSGFWIWGTITINGALGQLLIDFHLHGTTAGTAVVATGTGTYKPGTNQPGTVAVEAEAAATTGSCAAGTASGFTVVGTATGVFP